MMGKALIIKAYDITVRANGLGILSFFHSYLRYCDMGNRCSNTGHHSSTTSVEMVTMKVKAASNRIMYRR